jgi:hypothetical protein
MKCPICDNMIGFTCGTCIDCGYNYIDHTFHFIEISTETLEAVVSPEVFEFLVEEHRRFKER